MREPYDCPHGMGKATSCVECMEEGPVAPPEPLRLSAEMWLESARFRSLCGRCDAQIEEGDPIGKHIAYGWCCSGCVKEPSS